MVLEEMNRLGMIVDLAHVSVDTMKVVLNISKAPVIFSHSSAYSLCQHRRNVPDDVLRMVVSAGARRAQRALGAVWLRAASPPGLHRQPGDGQLLQRVRDVRGHGHTVRCRR